MKLLLVEDDENKGIKLSGFIKDAFPGVNLQLERSLQSGLRRIRNELPDLVLLDMTLPNYDIGPDEPGGDPHSFAGRDFLDQMDRLDIVLPVIVITQYETFGRPPKSLSQLDEELRADYPSSYCGAVYYHASIHEWKDQLKRLVESSMNIRGSDSESHA
jgi:CheY-like chemotaxis protein